MIMTTLVGRLEGGVVSKKFLIVMEAVGGERGVGRGR